MKRDPGLYSFAALFVCVMSLHCLGQETQPSEGGKQPEEAEKPNIVRTQLTDEQVQQQANSPGPAHKLLEFMVGEFEVSSKYWADAKAEPVQSKGKAKGEWQLGGRYVMTRFEGEMSGKPLNGIGMVGFDGVDEQFINMWMDDASTRVVIEKGFYDHKAKQFKYENDNNFYDVGVVKSRTVVVPHEDANYSVVIYHTYQDTPEFKILQLDFQRVGATPKPDAPAKP